MARGKEMHSEEIKLLLPELLRRDQQRDSRVLAIFELLPRVREFPRVPVFQYQVFVLGEELVDVVGACVVEEVVEAGV